jgi:hypothetical protein
MFSLSPQLLRLHTPHTAHAVIFTIVSVSLAAILVASVVVWRRTGKPTMLLLTLGGGLCCLNESLVDLLGHCYFPTHGGVMGLTLFGRTVPVWVEITYAIFFGTFPFLLSELLKRGTSRKAMWGAIVGFWVANSVLEVPLLSTHLYVYYGEQPFKVARFPIEWLTINVLGAFLAAVIAARGASVFRGRRQLWLLLVPLASYFASWIVDMPAFWALGSHASTAVRYCGVGLALVLGVLAIDVLIRVGRVEQDAPDHEPQQGETWRAGTTSSSALVTTG